MIWHGGSKRRTVFEIHVLRYVGKQPTIMKMPQQTWQKLRMGDVRSGSSLAATKHCEDDAAGVTGINDG